MRSFYTTIASLFLVPGAFAEEPVGGYYQTHWRTFNAIVSGKPIESSKPAKPDTASQPTATAKPAIAMMGRPVAVETVKPAAPTVVQAAALLPAKADTTGPRAWMGRPTAPVPKLLPTLGVPH